MKSQTLIFGAGCFWGVEELIREVHGVIETEVGYSGGTLENPTYRDICTGNTGHAEAIKVTFDPSKTNLKKLIALFFRLHDPTTLNRQGNDAGSQYRSVLFYKNTEEKEAMETAIKEAQEGWDKPIVTTLEPEGVFYSAESEHQDYLQKNPHGYTCHYWRE